MSGEEMEMETSADFGSYVPAEDIDIDVDFVVETHDEDLELGDFEQMEELQQFNSDTKDELMAEDDDASYGMIDVDDDEIAYNESAAATTNDYDIDIGGVEVVTWQESTANAFVESGEPIEEDQHTERSVTDHDVDVDAGSTDRVVETDQQIERMEPLDSVLATGEFQDPTVEADDAHLLYGLSNADEGVASKDFGTIQTIAVSEASVDDTDHEASESYHENDVPNVNNVEEQDHSHDGRQVDIGVANATTSEATPTSVSISATKLPSTDDYIENQDVQNNVNTNVHADELETGHVEHDEEEHEDRNEENHEDGQEEDQAAGHADTQADDQADDGREDQADDYAQDFALNHAEDQDEEEISFDPLDDGQLVGQDGSNASLIPPATQQLGQDSVSEAAEDTAGSAEWANDVDADASYEEDAHNEEPDEVAGTPGEAEDVGLDTNVSPAHGEADDSNIGDNADGNDGLTEHRESVAEQPASIATRHEIFVVYGETEYRLFAKTVDDDPEQYFFKDVSALEFSMEEFLAGIRSVISDEVSPLDELVMHVDGLGLEFSESSKDSFLTSQTFGDILTLYDVLVKNDEPENIPELYVYLTMRPSCAQRLMALQNQAKAGRGLTDVAVYRDHTPVWMNSSGAIEGEVSQITPDSDFDDGAYDEEDAPGEEQEMQDEYEMPEQELEAEPEADANQETDATPPAEDGAPEYENPSEEVAAKTSNDNVEDDLVDYDELDLSPSNQGHTVTSATANATSPAVVSAPTDIVNETNEATAADDDHQEHVSQSTSATVTLNGDDKDEINYDDADASANNATAEEIKPAAIPGRLMVPADDEITWESENDEAFDEDTIIPSKPSEQVSMTPGKRMRSDSDAPEVISEQSDVKRRRS